MTLQQLRESGFQDADIEAAYWLAKLGRGDSSPVVFHQECRREVSALRAEVERLKGEAQCLT